MSREEDFDKFKVGTKVKFIEEWESFPHFHVKKGLSGKVVRNDCMGIAIKMDEKLDGAEYWDNEVHFYLDDEVLYPSEYIEIRGGKRNGKVKKI